MLFADVPVAASQHIAQLTVPLTVPVNGPQVIAPLLEITDGLAEDGAPGP